MKKFMSFLAILLLMSMLMSACVPTQKKDDASQSQPSPSEDDKIQVSGRLQQIKEKGKLIIATSADYPPYEFHATINGKDEFVGFDMELARAIAKALDVEIEIQDMGFDAVLASVDTGMADLGIAGIGRRPEREEHFEFSNEYYNSEQSVIVRKEDAANYKNIEDFKGKKVGAQIGTIQAGIAEKIEGAEAKLLSKLTDMVIELQTGMVDAIIIELPVGRSYSAQNQDLQVLEEIKFPTEGEGTCVIADKGETELIAEINKIIADLKQDGKIEEFVVDAYKLVEELGVNE